MSRRRKVARAAAAAPIAEHRLAPELLTRAVRVLVVGCGGSGSAVAAGLPLLHQAMLAAGHPGGLEVTLLDDDLVSPTNTVRQPFAPYEVGHAKAVVLANRVNLFYQQRWRGVPERLQARGPALAETDVVIGCVDTRAGRAAIAARTGGASRVRYWLDLGNEASTGQFVLGQPANAVNAGDDASRLRTVAELYPETADASKDAQDRAPACSAIEALERQEPFVNATVATAGLALLARLLRHGRATYHGGFVNLATGRTTCLPVSPDVWARIGEATQRAAALERRRQARQERAAAAAKAAAAPRRRRRLTTRPAGAARIRSTTTMRRGRSGRHG